MYAYSVECPLVEWEWTNNWQEAIDVWSEMRARYGKENAHIYVWPSLEEGKMYEDNDWIYQLSSRDVIHWWSTKLMKEENMNRVEKRIVKEIQEQEYDGMDCRTVSCF